MTDKIPETVQQMVVDAVEPATKVDETASAEPSVAASGTNTPGTSELPPDQVAYSLKVSLADICAKAAVLYSQQKNYEAAAEFYARAAEMQAEMNGEMDPENAEILFLYGRALFKVGQSKSDVLGGKAPETDGGAKNKKKGDAAAAKTSEGGLIAGAISAAGSASKDSAPAGPSDAKKPLFQFSGDEEWDASDDDDEDAGANGDGDDEEDEEDDDLAVAFEVLDLSRVLFEKKLEQTKASGNGTAAAPAEDEQKGKGVERAADADASTLSPPLRHILERLADTHDLLAEISLENERYPNAIVDSRASLSYKKQFLREESELIAEAHFKLSLALEFASVTTSGDEDAGADAGAQKQQPQQVDQALRDEAVVELEAAIASTKLKLQNKEVELATLHSPEDNDASRRQIVEVKEMIADMEQRLVDLRKPPIDLNAAVNGPAGAGLGGLLGALGGAAAGSSDVVAEAKKGATDLTGLVRKKAKDAAPVSATSPAASEANSAKRKAEEPADGSDDETKKVRTDAA